MYRYIERGNGERQREREKERESVSDTNRPSYSQSTRLDSDTELGTSGTTGSLGIPSTAVKCSPIAQLGVGACQ